MMTSKQAATAAYGNRNRLRRVTPTSREATALPLSSGEIRPSAQRRDAAGKLSHSAIERSLWFIQLLIWMIQLLISMIQLLIWMVQLLISTIHPLIWVIQAMIWAFQLSI
ncbi:MAG TPA: hypothetical protein VGS22_10745 [Thermoanaerobaculia bacterium]|jgi:hypothetical protein|nr:hypothetical protein [Thermoanaerobaculia bacterium]